jgi:hypothetical protein
MFRITVCRLHLLHSSSTLHRMATESQIGRISQKFVKLSVELGFRIRDPYVIRLDNDLRPQNVISGILRPHLNGNGS